MKPDRYEYVVGDVANVEGVSAIKIGFVAGLTLSLPRANGIAKSANPDLITIYDHQKAGTDITDTGEAFAEVIKGSGVDAAILFPFTGPNVEEAWIKGLQDQGVRVIVGAEMTHDNIAGENGYIRNDAFKRMFDQAVKLDVSDFVVPGNKPEKVAGYKELFDEALGEDNYAFYAPGFVAQGGTISDAGKAAGNNWHAIVGRGIFNADSPRAAAEEQASQIREAE